MEKPDVDSIEGLSPAIRVKKLKLRNKVLIGGLTDMERDIALLALLQKHDLLG